MDVNSLIESFGFPIFVCIASGYGLYKMWNQMVSENTIREERNYEMLGKFSVSIEKFAELLQNYEKKLSVIENDVKVIKDIVNK